MKALVTGGAGFIGSHLAEELLKQGDEVSVIDDLSTGKLENIEHLKSHAHFNVVIESILNETVMDRLVSECDIIYHLAAAVGVELIVSKPVEVIETNILGTETVLKLASRYCKKVIIASTSEIYGKSRKVPFKEDDDRILGPTTKKRWSYSCSKAIDEFLALAYHEEKKLQIIIIRLFNTIGPRQIGQYGMVVPRLINQALKGDPITVYGDGKQVRCFAYVSDVVGAVIKLVSQQGAIGRIFNIGSNQSISIMDLAKRIKDITCSDSKIKLISYDKAYEEGFEDMMIRIPDLSKINTLIGYKPEVDLDEALRRVVESLKSYQKIH